MAHYLIDDVVAHAGRVARSPLGATTSDAALMLVLDALGVGIAGSTSPQSATARAVAATWGRADEATTWGVRESLPAGSAAFVNAHQMHCLEFDAIHEPSVVHPMSVVLPVLVAWAQRERGRGRALSGADLLRGVVVGVDVAAGLGDVTTTPLQFFRPGTAGALGAVAALATVARAEPEVSAGAMGVVYGALSGTMQPHTEGAQVLALQVAFNARAALHSWDLAVAGFRGPRQVLEGRFGYFRLIEAGGDPERLVRRLGSQWEVERTSIKPFPSGRATHGALDAVLELQSRHGFTMADVAAVEARVPPMVERLVGRPADGRMTAGAARLCLPFLIPVALQHGTVDLSSYSEERLADPAVLELAERVSVVPDDNPDPNAFDPQTVTVTLRDGRVLTMTKAASLGSPAQPMTQGQLRDKLRSNLLAAGRHGDAERLREAVSRLPETDDVTALLELV